MPVDSFIMKFQISLALLLVLQLSACSEKSDEPSKAAQKPAESRVKHGPNGEVNITLDTDTRKVMGLEVAAVKEVQLPQSIKAYGRVVDASQFATQFSEMSAAAITSEASQKEVQRLKTLAEQNNASQKALQAAEATAAHDQSQLQAARLRLIASWGSSLANRPDLALLVQSLISLSNVLVQLTLPGGQSLGSPPSTARIFASLSTNSSPIDAEFAGTAPAVDPQFQGQQVFFLIKSSPSDLVPGIAVIGSIAVPGEPRSGILVPRNAIVRYNGAAWVYQEKSETTFARVEVQLVEPLETGWFTGSRLKDQDKVVVTGAQLLLSEELKGQSEE